MSSTKFAKLIDGVVDVVSYYPDRERIVDTIEVPLIGADGEPTGEAESIVTGWHWGDVLPEWVEVPDEVFAGFEKKGDSWAAPIALQVPKPTSYIIAKSTPWVRMTEQEAELIAAAMESSPARLRGIYDAAGYLSTDDALWPMLRSTIASALGSEERADELLAAED